MNINFRLCYNRNNEPQVVNIIYDLKDKSFLEFSFCRDKWWKIELYSPDCNKTLHQGDNTISIETAIKLMDKCLKLLVFS